ncbi:NUDIX hydrolase [Clostridioides difficile]|uniref:NUDIX hydrolase n=1 Tax=Clostridioides difficile TaxID=1496 RepID=UPI002239300E|nr:NUDIX hydrolase N-terminal domain-containing protein [Clostridioides difficile]
MSQLQGIAQTGLHYSKDIYDIERYEQLKSITLKLIQELSNEPTEKIELFLDSDTGYATPKIDIRAVVFNENGHLLMVKEKSDSSWALPGGWADIGYSAGEVAIKEVQEEAGINVTTKQIIAVYDKFKRRYKPSLEYVYKFFIECEFISGKISPGLETSDVAYISEEEFENLNISLARNSIDDLKMLYNYYKNPSEKTLFD